MLNKLIKTLCVSCWTAYILQDDTRSIQYQAAPFSFLFNQQSRVLPTTISCCDVGFRFTSTGCAIDYVCGHWLHVAQQQPVNSYHSMFLLLIETWAYGVYGMMYIFSFIRILCLYFTSRSCIQYAGKYKVPVIGVFIVVYPVCLWL